MFLDFKLLVKTKITRHSLFTYMKRERLSENACMKHKLARQTRVLTAPDAHRHTDMRGDRKQGRQRLRQTMTLPHLADGLCDKLDDKSPSLPSTGTEINFWLKDASRLVWAACRQGDEAI